MAWSTSSRGSGGAILTSRTSSHPQRRLACPHCAHAFEVARRAMNARCPKCTGQIDLQNVVVGGVQAGTVTTMGEVRVTRRGAMSGRLDCGALRVEGTLTGEATVRGSVRVESRGSIRGNLSATSLVIPAGGRFEGELRIEPPTRRQDAENEDVT